MNNCPHCDTILIGEPIPGEYRPFYGGSTHYKREIGMEYPEKYDGVWEWKCPDCGETWPSEANRKEFIKFFKRRKK